MRHLQHAFTTLLLIATISTTAFAETTEEKKAFQGCSGGMMLHMGYLFGQNENAPCSPQGATMGVGGAARVNLWKYLRIGGEGYVSTMHSSLTDCASNLAKGSYIRSGWGGILADFCYRGERAWPFIGATIGGGAMRGLYITNGNQNDWTPETTTTVNKQAFFCIDPFVGCEYAVTQRIHLIFKADWLLALHHSELLQPTGPRAYIGIMFCH